MWLLEDVGRVCEAYQRRVLKNLPCKRIQRDEIWSFCYAKQKNVKAAKAAPANAGDVWTWTGIDAESKLIISWSAGGRDAEYAMIFMDDIRSRLAPRPANDRRPQSILGGGRGSFRW